MANKATRKQRISLFGHFGAGNFGNESTLLAMLCHLRMLRPDAEVTCICTEPEVVAVEYGIATVPMSGVLIKPWPLQSRLARLARKVLIGIPCELYRWLTAAMMLWRTDVLIIPGTGLLTDAFSLVSWGPYSTFKWSMIAKLCRCHVLFVSVGAGPLHGRIGRFLVKSALSLADFRSYRDWSTIHYLKGIGFRPHNDRVYPDLAFGLPAELLPAIQSTGSRRLVVGIGLMNYGGMYSIEKPTSADYAAYLETLASFVKWLLGRGYDVRLLVGDRADIPVMRQFNDLMIERLTSDEKGRVVGESVASATHLLSQLAVTDLVVGTRFHNVLLALLLNKPSIAISFHHKCSSLMSEMGMSQYCQDIKRLNSDTLIKLFCELETNARELKGIIGEKVAECRKALDEQYRTILNIPCLKKRASEFDKS